MTATRFNDFLPFSSFFLAFLKSFCPFFSQILSLSFFRIRQRRNPEDQIVCLRRHRFRFNLDIFAPNVSSNQGQLWGSKNLRHPFTHYFTLKKISNSGNFVFRSRKCIFQNQLFNYAKYNVRTTTIKLGSISLSQFLFTMHGACTVHVRLCTNP